MARTVIITSGKGGVGKSSVTINIGYALASQGHKVCLIDADFGLKNLDVMMGLENRVIYDLKDVITSKATLHQVLVKDKRKESLYLLPAYKSLSLEHIDMKYMMKIIDELKNDFDFILIDSPAGIEKGFQYAAALSSEAIVVVTLDVVSIRDADRVIGLLMKQGVLDIHMLINKYNDDDVNKGRCMNIKDAYEMLSVPLIGIIYDDHSIIEANNKGMPIYLNNQSVLKECYYRISKRMLGISVPFMKLKKKALLKRIIQSVSS